MDRVVSKETSGTYHKPRRGFGSVRCGSINLTEEGIETGVIELEPRESAEEKGLVACERCFPHE